MLEADSHALRVHRVHASFLARPAFGPYLSLLGQTRAYEPAAASIISFGLTWMAMILIAFIGRGSRARVVIAGAR